MLFITLQQALFKRLTEAGFGLTVYDSSESLKKTPAVVLFSPTLTPLSDKTSYYKEVQVKLMVVSEEKRGKRDTYEALGVITKAMKAKLELADASVDVQKLSQINDTTSQGNGLQSTSLIYKFNITTKEEL